MVRRLEHSRSQTVCRQFKSARGDLNVVERRRLLAILDFADFGGVPAGRSKRHDGLPGRVLSLAVAEFAPAAPVEAKLRAQVCSTEVARVPLPLSGSRDRPQLLPIGDRERDSNR